jgi:sterol desaturase/sphingolipid hydroxylase (fatty acid hydroxylase superfamily)
MALVAMALAVVERVPAWRLRPARLLRPWLGTDVVYLLTGYVAGGALAGAWVAWATGWLDRYTGLGRVVWSGVPAWAQVPVALVALDLGNYGVHWALHRSDRLWVFHEAHHSSRHLDWMATFRSHVVEQLLRRALAPLALVLAGVPPAAVGTAAAAFLAWAMLNHANVRLPLGALERVLVTPRLHRVHHVPATTERNLGTVFTWWDRLRGTLVLAEPPPGAAFGLPREREVYPQGWGRQLVAPWTRRRPGSAGTGVAAAGGRGR